MIISKVLLGRGKVGCRRGAMEYGRSIKWLSDKKAKSTHPDGMPRKRLKTLAIEIAPAPKANAAN